MRLSVSDVVSPSYFVATAAVELGFFKQEGLDVEFVWTPEDSPTAFRDGEIDFLGASPYTGLSKFPGWKGAKVLCALSQYTYWFLALRADLKAQRGDVSAVKNRRITASGRPGQLLTRVLVDSGLDLERDNIRMVSIPQPPGTWARLGADAIEAGVADGFWGNGMRVEYAVRKGLATILLDIRRGDGPPQARGYTFPALLASERLVQEQPEVAAGAVRAIVKTQRALAADPTLATRVGDRVFPPEEAALIADLIARDVEFYDARISREAVAGAAQFAQQVGFLSGDVTYEGLVATQYADLWTP
jgi:ABC-type nitrate/sulfonate/bicarbonate transport system substrate-binding protein